MNNNPSPSSFDSGNRDLVVGTNGNAGITKGLIIGNAYDAGKGSSVSYRGFIAYNHSEDSLLLNNAGQDEDAYDGKLVKWVWEQIILCSRNRPRQ